MSVTPFPPRERTRFVDDLLGYMSMAEKLGQLALDRSANDPAVEAAIIAGEIGGVHGTTSSRRLQGLAVEHSRLGIPLLITAQDTTPVSPWALAASWDQDVVRTAGQYRAAAAMRAGANALRAPQLTLAERAGLPANIDLAGEEPHLMAHLGSSYAIGAGTVSDASQRKMGAFVTLAGDCTPVQRRCAAEIGLTAGILGIDASTAPAAGKLDIPALLIGECRRILALVRHVFTTTTTATLSEAAEWAIKTGMISPGEIDHAVRGVLTIKHSLGLFRDPIGTGSPILPGAALSSAEISARTMVLLRNEGGLLPLSAVSDRVLIVSALDGAGAACTEGLRQSGVGFMAAPGLALRRPGESWAQLTPQDHLALALTHDAAERADFVLIVLEDRHFEPVEGEQWQGPTPAVQSLIQALSRSRAQLVALVATPEPVMLGVADRHFAAILQCWQPRPGFEEALGDILSGRRGPEGRMPVTVGHFPCGHGLGFGECIISNYRLEIGPDHVAATARVRNAGPFDAKETVQAYVRSPDGELRLAGFTRVSLSPDEDIPIRIELGRSALGELGQSGRFQVMPGRREILLGKSASRFLSSDIQISDSLARAITTGRTIPLRSASQG